MVIGVCEASEQCNWSSLKWWRTYIHTPFPLKDSAHPVGWAEWKPRSRRLFTCYQSSSCWGVYIALGKMSSKYIAVNGAQMCELVLKTVQSPESLSSYSSSFIIYRSFIVHRSCHRCNWEKSWIVPHRDTKSNSFLPKKMMRTIFDYFL